MAVDQNAGNRKQEEMSSPVAAPIPTTLVEQWRRVRFKVMHLSAFVIICSAAALVWLQLAQPLSFPGQVEVIQASVTATEGGVLTNLWVTSFQPIKAGEVVGEILGTDSHGLDARLEVLRDRMRLTQMEMGPILNRQRNALEFEQLTLSCARLQTELAMSRLRLLQHSNDWQQAAAALHRKEKGVTQTDVDSAKAKFEAVKTEVEEKSKLIELTEKGVKRVGAVMDKTGTVPANDPLREALQMEEEKIKALENKLKPVPLLAPISGAVTAIHHHPGEHIQAGQPVVTITSQKAHRIVGFMPPNFQVVPQIGLNVEIRTRSRGKKKGSAKIIGVGPQLEAMTNVLTGSLAARLSPSHGMGRPVSISLPVGLHLLPGEPVDILVK